MIEAKHTPGPWKVSGRRRQVIGRHGAIPCLLARVNVAASGVECDANARLIAAAPDLLAACEAAIQFIRNGVEFGYIRLPDAGDPALLTPPALEAAVAKAKGGAP